MRKVPTQEDFERLARLMTQAGREVGLPCAVDVSFQDRGEGNEDTEFIVQIQFTGKGFAVFNYKPSVVNNTDENLLNGFRMVILDVKRHHGW